MPPKRRDDSWLLIMLALAALVALAWCNQPSSEGADWQDVTIPAGGTESDPIAIPLDAVSAPPGKLRGADGTKFQGNARPRFHLEAFGADQCKVVLDAPAPQDLVLKVKAEDDDA